MTGSAGVGVASERPLVLLCECAGTLTNIDFDRLERHVGLHAEVLRDTRWCSRVGQARMLELLDAGAGQGMAFDWRWIGAPGRPFFLAGGISLENIDRARALNPFAVDVSSGAETGGVKDEQKMLELVRRAHDE